MSDNPQAELNDLIREAFSAQEAFDNWDEGKTYTSGSFSGPRYCTLDVVCRELDEANLKLVRFASEHSATLIAELAQ